MYPRHLMLPILSIPFRNMQVIQFLPVSSTLIPFRIILTIFGTGNYLMIFISLQDIVRFLDLGEHHDGDGSVLWGLLADFDGNHHDFCLRHFSRASASTSVQNSGKWSRSRHMLWALLLGCSSFWCVYMSSLISTNLYISIRLYNPIVT